MTSDTSAAISAARWVGIALLATVCAVPGAARQDPDPGGSRAGTGGARWGAGYFPNVRLTSHEGRSLRFFDDLIADKVVVINFIYTSCPDVCPLETAKLTELQAILGERVGRDVFMYSISIDPEVDTPEVLREYAERYQVGPGWLFLTGDGDDITLLRKKLGLYIDEIQDEDSKDHNLSLIIGNQTTGRWMKRSPFENPYYLANQVGSWLHNWKTPAPNQDSYADAPQLRQMTTGERLFRTRCASCHVIGGRDLVPPHQSGRLLGPDLLGVTERRERAWLARWLAEPDAMLAEKDPIAMQLYAEHGNVSMPNLDLNADDVSALIDYMEVESRRFAVAERSAAAGADVPVACCQKDEAAVIASPGESSGSGAPAPRTALGAVTRYSVGLGCVFLALAGLYSRRPWTSTGRPASGEEAHES